MVYRPFSNLSRFMLAACAVGLGVGSLNAQTCQYQPPRWGLTHRELMCFWGTRISEPMDR